MTEKGIYIVWIVVSIQSQLESPCLITSFMSAYVYQFLVLVIFKVFLRGRRIDLVMMLKFTTEHVRNAFYLSSQVNHIYSPFLILVFDLFDLLAFYSMKFKFISL